MGLYTTVDNAFWTDSSVIDNYTPEDKYFYLYLLTNIHVNMSGCFEVSLKQVAQEMGYSRETVEHLIDRFISVHKAIDYDADTKEILIHNWAKYHWTTSSKYLTALRNKVDMVKSERFSLFLNAQIDQFVESHGKSFIPYRYGIDTTCIDTTVTVTDIYNIPSKKENVEYLGNEEKKVKKEKKSGSVDGQAVSESAAIEVVQADEKVEVIDSVLANHSPELISAVDSWMQYKKEKRQNYQPKGRQTLLKTIDRKANEFGDAAVVNAIEETMANGYQGIVWDYLRKNGYRGGYGGRKNGGFASVDLGDLI